MSRFLDLIQGKPAPALGTPSSKKEEPKAETKIVINNQVPKLRREVK